MERVAIIWKYAGKDRSKRLREIEGFHQQDFKIIPMDGETNWMEALRRAPRYTEACLFWIDDDKPVSEDFVQEMVRPLSSADEARAVLHVWSGNALAVTMELLNASAIESVSADSLWRLIPPILDVANSSITGQVHVAFSSTERLAPMCMDPVGIPS